MWFPETRGHPVWKVRAQHEPHVLYTMTQAPRDRSGAEQKVPFAWLRSVGMQARGR